MYRKVALLTLKFLLNLLSSKLFQAFSHQPMFLKNLRHDLGFLVVGPIACEFVRSKTVTNATLISLCLFSNIKAMSLHTCFLLLSFLRICFTVLKLSHIFITLFRGAILETTVDFRAKFIAAAFHRSYDSKLIRFGDNTQYKSQTKRSVHFVALQTNLM